MDYAKNIIAHIMQLQKGKKPAGVDENTLEKCGIGRTTYYKIRSGNLDINLNTLIVIAQNLGITLIELLSDPEEKKRPVPRELEYVIDDFSYLEPEELGEAMDSLAKTVDQLRIGRERRESGEKPKSERSIAAGSIRGKDGPI